MASNVDPIVGNWYQGRDKHQAFEVVAYDEEEGIIEVQYVDGGADEVDLDTWNEWDLKSIENPESWSGSVDEIEMEDLGYDESDLDGDEWDSGYGETRSFAKGIRGTIDEDWDEGVMDAYRWDEDE